MSILQRGTPTAESTAVTITAVPSGAVGLVISGLKPGGPSGTAGPRFSYLSVRANAGTVTLPAGTLICVQRGGVWKAIAVLLNGVAIDVTTAFAVEDFLQGVADADRITLFAAGATGQVVLQFGYYDEV